MASRLRRDAPDIIAETATEYYKLRFDKRKKEFDGEPWVQLKHPEKKKVGSLLVGYGGLADSIKPAKISENEVIIQAGNSKVGYAKVHNEGFKGP